MTAAPMTDAVARLRRWAAARPDALLLVTCGRAYTYAEVLRRATAVAAARLKRTERKVKVTLPGGELTIEWRADDHVLMTGPVAFEFNGTFNPALFEQATP